VRWGLVPGPGGSGSPTLRRGPVCLSRWGGVPSAPRSRWFPVPSRPGSRRSEECRLPDPGEARRPGLRGVPVALPRWGGGPVAPRSSGFPVPGGAGRAVPRGAPSALSRRGLARGAPRSAVCLTPVGPGARPLEAGDSGRGGMGCRTSEEVRFPVPWGGVPHLRGGPVPCPGGVGCRWPREASGSLSRWGGVPSTPRSRWFPVPLRLGAR
jgi:hypothetical protein